MLKRGSAAVLAMIFLVMFSALSAAFYAMVDTSIAVSKNDRNAARARAAAESGMEYVKHLVAKVEIPGTTPDDQILSKIKDDLALALNSSPDVATGQVTLNGSIQLPTINLEPRNEYTKQFPQRFTGSIGKSYVNGKLRLSVVIDGCDVATNVHRHIGADFIGVPRGANIFDYDLASAGLIEFSNSSLTSSGVNARGNVMSASTATPSIVIANSTINGGLGVVLSEDQVNPSNRGKILVDGQTDPAAIINNVYLSDPPPIPPFNPNIFETIVPLTPLNASDITNKISSYDNRVLASSQTTVKFPSNTVINGILFVKSPNKLEFGGSVTLNGIIVFEQRDGFGPESCSISMSGNYTFIQNVSAIPANLAEVCKGYTILAPTARITLGGSTDFFAQGSTICDSFSATNSGTTVNIHNGTVLTLSQQTSPPAMELDQGTMNFTRDANAAPPTVGVSYLRQFLLLAESYEEVN